MKKITTLLFLLLALPFYGQWVQQNYNIGLFLNDVYCITEDIVVVVGDAGAILKTTDGGLNWIAKPSGSSQDLNKVQFVNQQIGYIVGENGTLLKTIDGGESWMPIATGISTYLTGLSCINENLFFIAEDGGYIRKTINGGSSFETVNFGEVGFLDNIQFLNEMTGYANSYEGLYKTIDGGTSWFLIHNDVFSFFFFNENVGFVNAMDGLNKTIDGGMNYIYLDDIPFVMHKLFATSEDVVWGVTRDFLFDVPQNNTMRGEIDAGGEFHKTITDMPTLKSIYFANPTKGYGVVGHSIYKNSSGLLLGVNEVNTKGNITIYPNPSSNQITISLNEVPTQPFTIEIIDCLGKIIYSESQKPQANIVIPTTKFSKGVYSISIHSQEKNQIHKLIVN